MFNDEAMAGLLDIACATVRNELLGSLPPERRHTALMVANALSIASRYLKPGLPETGEGLAEALAALNEQTPPGPREALRTRLLDQCRAELRVANPKAL